MPSLVFEASKATLVAILLLVFEPKNTFVNSIATLFQHVFKQNVEDVYFYFTLKENSHVNRVADILKASSGGVDATPAATRERCRAVLHPQRGLLLYTQ